MSNNDLLALLQKLVPALAANTVSPPAVVITPPTVKVAVSTGPAPVAAGKPVPAVLSPIDQLFGGQALVGSKTMIGVLSYILIAVLKGAGVLGAATPAGQILTILSIAFTVLGGIAKIDRMSQSIGTIATNSK